MNVKSLGIFYFLLAIVYEALIINAIKPNPEDVYIIFIWIILALPALWILKMVFSNEFEASMQVLLKALLVSFIAMACVTFIIFYFYMPMSYLIEPKQLETNISMSGESRGSILTLSIENRGSDLKDVSFKIHGTQMGIQNGSERLIMINDNINNIYKAVKHLKFENEINLSLKNMQNSIKDVDANRESFNDCFKHIEQNITYIENNISININDHNRSIEDLWSNLTGIRSNIKSRDILISAKPEYIENIGSKDTRLVSLKIEALRETLSGSYKGAIEMNGTSNGHRVVEFIPISIKVDSSGASSAAASEDQKAATVEHNITLNKNMN